MKPEMIECPAGAFVMGSPGSGAGRGDDKTRHRVTFTQAFAMGRYPVTQALYEAVIGENPSEFKGPDLPVETVSWYDAVRFCNALSAKLGLEPVYLVGKGDEPSVFCNFTSPGYRLPTEAEWEYAYRAGTTTRYYNGADEAGLGDIAWCSGNANGTTHPVGQKEPNAWGFYDMAGNVREWTWDRYGTYPGTTSDYTGPDTGSHRVLRGGSWNFNEFGARASYRYINQPGYRYGDIGFRLARTL